MEYIKKEMKKENKSKQCQSMHGGESENHSRQ